MKPLWIVLGINTFAFLLFTAAYMEQKWYAIIKVEKPTKKVFQGSWIKPNEKALIQNFYRLYKFVHLQLEVGTRKEEIYKALYKVVDAPSLKKTLFQMSVIISQSHDVCMGIDYLKSKWKYGEGQLFVSLMESMEQTYLNQQTFSRLDHVMFQKYLANIRNETERIKRQYWLLVASFTFIVTIMLLMPILSQMLYSSKQIFVN